MQLKQELETLLGKENVKFDESMSKHTSFKVGGNADIFVTINRVEKLIEVLKINDNKLPITIVGNGTNLLVKDSGIRGIVIKFTSDDIKLNIKNQVCNIEVYAGTPNIKLSQVLLKNNVTGFEFASTIPGTIGGAIYMNAGAFESEMKDIVKNVTFLDLMDKKIYTIDNKKCKFLYRKSIFQKMNAIILKATLELNLDKKENIEKKINQYKEKRMLTQPVDKPNAGSTFKRGEDFITAKLIDEAGLKGVSIGGAEVSTKHAGFIVNKKDATATDIIKLIDYVQKEVYKKFGKKIETEVRIIG